MRLRSAKEKQMSLSSKLLSWRWRQQMTWVQCMHLEDRRNTLLQITSILKTEAAGDSRKVTSYTLKMEAASDSSPFLLLWWRTQQVPLLILVPTYSTTQHHNPDNHSLDTKGRCMWCLRKWNTIKKHTNKNLTGNSKLHHDVKLYWYHTLHVGHIHTHAWLRDNYKLLSNNWTPRR
jgi:hypothetical protein